MGRPREANRVAIGETIAVLFCVGPGGRMFGVTIDKEDLPKVQAMGKWQVVRSGKRKLYAHKSFNGTKIRLHRFLVYSPHDLDHENGRGLDNRKQNLRPATRSQNMANMKPTGRFKGITFHERLKKYEASVGHFGKKHYLGVFDTPEEAAKAYDRKAIELFGEFAWLNFPATA